MITDRYIFKSDRLGFRKWSKNDLDEFLKLNSDEEVMEYFPKLLSKNDVEEFKMMLKNL